MKLFFLVSSLDLTQPFSATPAWWQLLKGLYECNVEVLAAPYQGPSIESVWWRAVPNPARLQGDAFRMGRDLLRRGGGSAVRADTGRPQGETSTERMTREAARTLVAPLWLRQIERVLQREPDIDALVFLTPPLNHLVGVAGEIQRRFHRPVFYYDGDVPASLPSMQGFASGFRIYQGADLMEYTAFISNSKAGETALAAMGARAVHTLYYGADPDLFAPVDVPQDIDVFFYGHGREYRDAWIDAMLKEPALAHPEWTFAARGKGLGDVGPTRMLPYLSLSALREYACRSRINLCITRQAHASAYASSSSRPFELAAIGCCIVASPYLGIETWFEPGRELIVLDDPAEASERYAWLLAHDDERRAMGAAARERVLKSHTFRHRARELIAIIQPYLS
jgi:hypothetical protein